MVQKGFTPVDHLLPKQQVGQSYHPASKESEPLLINNSESQSVEIHEINDYEPDKDVEKIIDVRKETIPISDDLKSMGVEAVSTSSFPTYKSITLPLADEKVVKGLHAPLTSSLRWLATLCMYILRKAHLELRSTNGKLVRVQTR